MKSILTILVALSAGILPACSVIVDAELSGKSGTDSGPQGPACDNTAQCLMLENHRFNCSLECINRVCVQTDDQTPNGTACGGPRANQICVDGACVERRCGDGYVDRSTEPAEYCDDGNSNDSDGCNNECTRSCVPPAPANCDDGNPCNGEEACGTVMGLCRASVAPPEDATCTMGDDEMSGTCQQGQCVAD